MASQILSISHPKLHLEILSEKEILQIHAATLEVIETVGVRFPSGKALEVLESIGMAEKAHVPAKNLTLEDMKHLELARAFHPK